MKKTLLLLTALLFIGVEFTHAQFQNIYTFNANAAPYGTVTIAGNQLFGCAYVGGAHDSGYFFSVHKDGSGFKNIWNCSDTGSNGSYPYGNVTVIKNRMYGFTYLGGANHNGVIFSIDTNGSGYKDLYDFTGATGDNPGWGTLNLIGNKFYGLLPNGGANGDGVLFSIDTNGSGYRDLLDFNGTNGQYPQDVQLAVSLHTLFGMTYEGGTHDSGVIFSVDTNGTGYKDLYDFNLSGGYYPEGHLIIVGNKLYGVTENGGTADSGVIFSLDTNGAGYKKMINLNTLSGAKPQGSLTYIRGKLYGMNYLGGALDTGDIFVIDTNGAGYKDLFDFSKLTGQFPYGNNFAVAGDTLYGMTYAGGAGQYGNIFRYIDTSIVTGVPEFKTTTGAVTLYPNPAKNMLNLSISQVNVNTSANIKVLDITGKELMNINTRINGNKVIALDIASFAQGMYFAEVVMGNSRQVIKFVKQ